MFSLNGKTALITGSGRGIGLAIAEAMAHQGANIYDRNMSCPTSTARLWSGPPGNWRGNIPTWRYAA